MQTTRQPKQSTKVRELKKDATDIYSSTKILSKKLYAKYYPITQETVKYPEVLGNMPDISLGISLLNYPLVVADGYPFAVIEGKTYDQMDDAKDAIDGLAKIALLDDVPEHILDGAELWMALVSKSLGIEEADHTAHLDIKFGSVFDGFMRERISSSRYAIRPVNVEDVAEAIAERLTVPEYKRNLCVPVKERIATIEYVNRMLVFALQQQAATAHGYSALASLLEDWMNKYNLHFSPDEMMGATTRWQSGKPNEPELPQISYLDCYPLSYEARHDLYDRLSLVFGVNLFFPDKMQKTSIPKRVFRGARENAKYDQRKPVTMKPYRPRGKGLIALPDGTKLVTVHNSAWSDDLIGLVSEVVEKYFDNQIA